MDKPNVQTIGKSIRLNRTWRGLTLDELAKAAGVSPAYLSRIECGKANPSLQVLNEIARALGVSTDGLLSSQLQTPIHQNGPGKRHLIPTIVRRDARMTMKRPPSSVIYELLTPDLQRQLQLTYVRHEPGETALTFSHEGEESIFCLEGTLQIIIGEQEFLLEPGDCISFDSSVPHRATAAGDGPAIIISAMTPPSF